MQTTVYKPVRKKLFNNKFLTYMISDSNGHGTLVEVEVKVVGRHLSYTYTSIRERG